MNDVVRLLCGLNLLGAISVALLAVWAVVAAVVVVTMVWAWLRERRRSQ